MIFNPTRCSLVAGAIALMLSNSAVSQSQSALSPARYKDAVAKITDCAAFKAALKTLPSANSFMRVIARTPGATKSEFESKAEYRSRIADHLGPAVGDASRVYIASKVNKSWTSYTTENGMEGLNFHAWPGLDENRLDLSLDWSSVTTGSYVGTTAIGLKRRVEKRRQETLTVGVFFPRRVIENTVYFKLGGSDAASLANGAGRLHVLGELVGASSRRSGGSPTFTNPLETKTTFDEVHLRPRCAYLTLNDRVLDAWSFDQW